MAVEVADRFRARRVHLVHVVPGALGMLPALRPPKSVFASVEQEAEERLGELEVPAATANVTREIRQGSPAQELAEAANAASADLIVV
ncbi:MAG: universal stress protein, partial [Myxococcales bacterium]|nr:universal stress protein [Myxococcales bacterium]